MAGWFKGFKDFFLKNPLTKLTAVFVTGTIGHKVSVVIGVLMIVAGLYYALAALVPLLVSVAGALIIQIAVNDHAALKREREFSAKDRFDTHDKR